jgi:hypothetical protein
MRGGKLTCNRTEEGDSDCLTLSCVDYEKGMFNSFKQVDCNIPQGWKKYRDDEAQANYWYNHDTGEATWLDPSNRGGKKKSKKNSRKNKKTKSRKMKYSRKRFTQKGGLTPEGEEVLKSFRIFDIYQDGTVSTGNLKDIFKRLGVPDKEAEYIANSADPPDKFGKRKGYITPTEKKNETKTQL